MYSKVGQGNGNDTVTTHDTMSDVGWGHSTQRTAHKNGLETSQLHDPM